MMKKKTVVSWAILAVPQFVIATALYYSNLDHWFIKPLTNLELFTFCGMMLFGVIAPIGWTATIGILGEPLESEVKSHPFFKHFIIEG